MFPKYHGDYYVSVELYPKVCTKDNSGMKWWIKIIIGALLPIGVGVAILIPLYVWIRLEDKPSDLVQYQIGFEYGKKNATEHIKQLRTEKMNICPIPFIDNISFCMGVNKIHYHLIG